MTEQKHAHERFDSFREVVVDLLCEGIERIPHHALPNQLECSTSHPGQDVEILRAVFDLALDGRPQLKRRRVISVSSIELAKTAYRSM